MIAVDPRLVAPGRGDRLRRPGRDHVAARVPPAPGHGPAGLGPRPRARRAAGARVTTPDGVDLLLEGGTVVDGTGAPGVPGRVAVDGDRIVAAGAGRGASRRRGSIDVTGHVVAPGFIDLHSHGGLVILAEPRHEPKVRQGVTTELIGVDGNSYAPFPRPGGPASTSSSSTPASTAGPDIAFDWSTVAEYLARYDRHGRGQRRLRRRQHAAPDRGPRLGRGARPTTRRSRTSGRGCARRWRTGRSACRRGSTTRPAPTPRPRSWRRSPRRPRGSAASTTPTSATRWATGSSTRSARRSRSGGGAARRPTSRTSTTGRRSRARPEQMLALVDDARAEGLDVTFDLYPSEWASTRLLIMLPTWIQAGGVGPLKERLADRAARDRIRDEMRGARPAVRRRPRLGRRCGSGRFTRPEHLEWEGRTLGELMRATGRDAVDAICDLLLAEDLRSNQVTPGPAPRRDPAVPPAPGVDDRDRRRAHRRQAVATDVRLVPADPGPARARGALARARGGGPPDDRRAGRAAGARGPRPDRRRAGGGPRGVRPGDGPVPGHVRRAAPVPRGHPDVYRQRRRGGRWRRAHGRDARPRAPRGDDPRERLPRLDTVRRPDRNLARTSTEAPQR